MLNTDVLIVGGGIIGLSILNEFNKRHPDLNIILLEKEASLARHASGRNSGVIHAGFYYTPDSLKAAFTVEGNKLLTEYCLANGIAINRCGKVVVTRNDKELDTLYELKKRGDQNGVNLELIDDAQLKELEYNANTYLKALYSPTTSTVNPAEVVNHLGENLNKKKGINILLSEKFIDRENAAVVRTNNQRIKYKYLINTAGLYADKIAHQFGVGSKYVLIPFKGLYLEYKDHNLVSKHVYPVPDLNNPFLGLHITKTVTNKVKIGPTAIPVFWRENYHGLSNFNMKEFLEIFSSELKLFYANDFNFRKVAFQEIKKYFKRHLIKQSSQLVKKIDVKKFGDFLRPGIRAQLLDRGQKKLVMDFVVEHGENSTHVLNAVSPAFTCAFSFSKFIVDSIEKNWHLK
ncbi:MAG: L-2-hydroxyglutarate oxidase [Deltaproteobacteria bacterium]|nr:L-2-hydroxyglutarate oxidase [Deltaproteobacteria bacterium]